MNPLRRSQTSGILVEPVQEMERKGKRKKRNKIRNKEQKIRNKEQKKRNKEVTKYFY